METRIVIDLSKSLVKVLYESKMRVAPNAMVMETDNASLPKTEVSRLSRCLTANPEDDAWLTHPDGTGTALGFLARHRYGGYPSQGLELLKHVTGTERFIAVLGAIAEASGAYEETTHLDTNYVKKKELFVKLVVLLPFGESTNIASFKENILKAGRLWVFRGVTYSLHPESEIEIMPEGAGMLLLRQSQLGLSNYSANTFATLIMGHYNVTGIITSRGARLRAESPPFGFHSFLESIVKNTSLDYSPRLTEAIALYCLGQPTLLRALLSVMVGDSETHIEAQLQIIDEVLAESRRAYWNSVSAWLVKFLGLSGALLKKC